MVTFKLIISRVVSILVDACRNADVSIDDEHISEEDKRCYGREVCCLELAATRLMDFETDILWQRSCRFGFETKRKGDVAFGAE
jgi:hypothetical protein